MAQYETEIDDTESEEENDEIEETIAGIVDECPQVLDSEDNAKILNDIFEMARTSYEKDKKGWQDFFANLKLELISTDDEDNTREILQNYMRKAKLELS